MKYVYIILSGLMSVGLIIACIIGMIIHYTDEYIFGIAFGVIVLPVFLNSVRFWNRSNDEFNDYVADMGDMV